MLTGSIPHIITLGLGNGTLAGQVPLVVTMGFGIGEEVPTVPGPYLFAALATHDPGAQATATHDPGGQALHSI